MRLSKPAALLVLMVTLVPLGYVAYFFGVVASAFVNGPRATDLDLPFVLLHLLMTAWCWGLLAFYAVALFKTQRVLRDQKLIWAVALFFLHIFTMLVFWWLYLWPRPVLTHNTRS